MFVLPPGKVTFSLPCRACGKGSVEHRDSGRTGLRSSTQTTPFIFMLKDQVGHYEVGVSQVSLEILEGFHNKESRRKRTAWPFSTGVEYLLVRERRKSHANGGGMQTYFYIN